MQKLDSQIKTIEEHPSVSIIEKTDQMEAAEDRASSSNMYERNLYAKPSEFLWA